MGEGAVGQPEEGANQSDPREGSAEEEALDGTARGVALFSAGQVATAALFGTPIAGGVLLALNKRRLGKPREAALRLAGAALLVALLALAGTALPSAVGWILSLAGVLAMGAWAARDRAELDANLDAGGSRAGAGPVIGVTLASLAGAGAVVFVARLLSPLPHIDFGHDQRVDYTEGVTSVDAERLGAELKRTRYFDDQRASSVRLSRRGADLVVAFSVKTGASVDAHECIGMHASARRSRRTPSQVRPCGSSCSKAIPRIPRRYRSSRSSTARTNPSSIPLRS